jgi:ABC-type dipeptide/oligopeptide/nickel transport system permease component
LSKFLLQRLLIAIPTLLVVTFLVFLIIRFIPGDPAIILAGESASTQLVAEIRAEWGLDQPVFTQYAVYMGNLLQGNLGRSIASRQPVAWEITQRYPSTLTLACLAIVVATVLGLGFGTIAAMRPFTRWDYGSMVLSLVGISTPIFWSGLIMILIFSVWLGVLPSGGTGTPLHWVLPAVSLGFFDAGVIARQSRSALMEVMLTDYVRTARAKGLSQQAVVIGHAMKNAIIPVVTIIGMEFGRMLGGAILTESVFSLPGIGRYLVMAISQRDYPVIQGICLILAITFVLINLAVDLLYGYLDPRIRQ